jgi:hypothetical protein
MSASTHVIFRISNRLAEKLKAFGDQSKSQSLQAKQMLILAVNDLDRRYLELVKYFVAAMEEAQGHSARSRRNDLLEPFERACDVIKSKVDAALKPSDLDENKRSRLIYEIVLESCEEYRSDSAQSDCINFIKEATSIDRSTSTDRSLKMLQTTIRKTKLRD